MKLPEKWQKVVEQNSDTLCNKVLGENEKKCVFNPKSKESFGQPNISAVSFVMSLSFLVFESSLFFLSLATVVNFVYLFEEPALNFVVPFYYFSCLFHLFSL